jgi:hypothetical protein
VGSLEKMMKYLLTHTKVWGTKHNQKKRGTLPRPGGGHPACGGVRNNPNVYYGSIS